MFGLCSPLLGSLLGPVWWLAQFAKLTGEVVHLVNQSSESVLEGIEAKEFPSRSEAQGSFPEETALLVPSSMWFPNKPLYLCPGCSFCPLCFSSPGLPGEPLQAPWGSDRASCPSLPTVSELHSLPSRPRLCTDNTT